jgi:FecR protein
MNRHLSICVVGFGLLLPVSMPAAPAPQGEVLGTEGSVDFARANAEWSRATAGQLLIVQDRLRTLALSRATLQLAELGRLRLNELTLLEILPPRTNVGKATLDLKAGAMYFFTRDRPREFLIQTPLAIAASRGTEFLVSIEPDGRNLFTMFDGEVELSNQFGSQILTNGDHRPGWPSPAEDCPHRSVESRSMVALLSWRSRS